MQKLYSQIIGLPVFDDYSPAPIALIQDILIDPENGKVIAFLIKNNKIIASMDVEAMHDGVHIADKSHILPIGDVLRATVVSQMHIPIIGEKVITEKSKNNLGQVVDYEIDTKYMVLSFIHVAKTLIFFRFQEKHIPSRQIVKITEKHVIVKDAYAELPSLEKEKSAAKSSAFAG